MLFVTHKAVWPSVDTEMYINGEPTEKAAAVAILEKCTFKNNAFC